MNFDVAIVGAGPAGIACGIQLKRQGINPVIFEKNEIGGLLRNANFVENYPGFAKGLSGRELVEKFSEHLRQHHLSPIFEEVSHIEFNNGLFHIQTTKSVYTSKYLVAASGTIPKKLDTEAFYEITELHKHDLAGKKIAIIGSGDAAFDYALNIASNSLAKEINILNKSEKTKCLPLLKQRVLENKKIKYFENTELNTENDYDYVLAAIGREPNIGFLDQGDSPNLYLVGDVKNGHFRQTSIAVGDGIRAAMEVYADISTIS